MCFPITSAFLRVQALVVRIGLVATSWGSRGRALNGKLASKYHDQRATTNIHIMPSTLGTGHLLEWKGVFGIGHAALATLGESRGFEKSTSSAHAG